MVLAYTCTNRVQEHHRKPIYCLGFNHCDPNNSDLVATVGSNKATVYRCLPAGDLEVLQVYTDTDEQDEEFYVVKWSIDESSGAPLLLLAGKLGNVHLVDCLHETIVQTYAGHGKAIHDIAVHPTHPHLFLSCSQDHSIRLWNMKSHALVALTKGQGCHTNEVISLDFNSSNPNLFLSSAMDCTVKVWTLEHIWDSVEASSAWDEAERPFPAKIIVHPIFSSAQLHGDYVDCVRWLGDLVLSKSVDHRIYLWQPHYPEDRLLQTSSKFSALQSFDLVQATMWWVRFSLDLSGTVLACGNGTGQLFVWDPTAMHHKPRAVLSDKGCTHVVRQTAVSADGSMILAGCEDGSVWRWDRLQEGSQMANGTESYAAGSDSEESEGSDSGGCLSDSS